MKILLIINRSTWNKKNIDMDFKDIKTNEVNNYMNIIKASANRGKCLKQCIMRSKSPKYLHELFDLLIDGVCPSAQTINQIYNRVKSITIANTALLRIRNNDYTFDDYFDFYRELVHIQNEMSFVDFSDLVDFVTTELLPWREEEHEKEIHKLSDDFPF